MPILFTLKTTVMKKTILLMIFLAIVAGNVFAEEEVRVETKTVIVNNDGSETLLVLDALMSCSGTNWILTSVLLEAEEESIVKITDLRHIVLSFNDEMYDFWDNPEFYFETFWISTWMEFSKHGKKMKIHANCQKNGELIMKVRLTFKKNLESTYQTINLVDQKVFINEEPLVGVQNISNEILLCQDYSARKIVLKNIPINKEIYVHNLSGQIVLKKEILTDEVVLDFYNLPKGLYIISVQNKNFKVVL